MKPNLLIFTNGFEGTWPAIEYGTWLARNMQAHLTLTGVVEPNDIEHPVEGMFSQAVSLFQDAAIDYSLELEKGLIEEIINGRTELQQNPVPGAPINDILIAGTFGRAQVRRMIVGQTFRSLMATISVPILYVPAARIPIRRVLICMGGLGYASSASQMGLNVARMSHAAVTFLTVVPPIDMDYPEARKIRDNWRSLATSDTLAGRSLREGMQKAQELGLGAKVTVRHGKIVEQILAEVKEVGYELICMGSQYSSHGLRHLYTPNITADVAEVSQCPIVTVRFAEPRGGDQAISSPTPQSRP